MTDKSQFPAYRDAIKHTWNKVTAEQLLARSTIAFLVALVLTSVVLGAVSQINVVVSLVLAVVVEPFLVFVEARKLHNQRVQDWTKQGQTKIT